MSSRTPRTGTPLAVKSGWRTFVSVIEKTLPALVLLVLLTYSYVYIVQLPYVGFDWQPNGLVISLYVDAPQEASLRPGDRITRIGQIHWQDFTHDLRLPLFDNVQPGQALPIVVERDGETQTIPWIVPGPQAEEFKNRLFNFGIVAYTFWLVGTATLLFARPKDVRWRLLIAFCYLTALWLLMGSVSVAHFWGGAILLRMLVWAWVPATLHLHWSFPKSLARLPKLVWPLAHLIGLALAIAQWFQLLSSSLYFLGFLVAVLGSFALLVVHFVVRPQERGQIRFVVIAAALALIPPIGLGIVLSVLKSASSSAMLALGFFPVLPVAYFYAIYRHRLGGLELRVNQAITIYLFLVLLVAIGLILYPVTNSLVANTMGPMAAGFLVSAIVVFVAVLGFAPFQRFVERRLLGITMPPNQIIASYAARVAASLDTETLIQLLRDEIAPSLLIRQSALFSFDGAAFTLLYHVGVDAAGLSGELPSWLSQAGHYRPPEEDPEDAGTARTLSSWVRLTLLLSIGQQLNGIWLMGRRDPDDYYSQQDIVLLRSVANQTAIALNNIAQAERLRALYQNDVDQREAERASLARELHDNVLNRLSALKNAVPEDVVSPTFDARYNTLADSLRHMITGLRPAALNYGLHLALTDLVDSLNSPDDTNGPEITLALAEGGEPVRHDAQVELHVYRIVQQACDNALTHSRARCVTIRGHVEAGSIDLTVEDDGVGFEAEGRLDLSRLTAHKHFGLAGMFERANIVGAKLQVDSAPGSGTRVRVTWDAASR